VITLLAGERQFAEHLRPVWEALPEEIRGELVIGDDVWTPRRLGAVLVASHADLRAARESGANRIAYIEHGAGQSYGGEPHRERYGNKWCPHCHPSYSGGADHEDVSLFLVPGPHPAARWRAAYPAARVEIVGCPKLDTLPRNWVDEPVVALSFHFNAGIGSPEADSLFRFYRRRIPELARRYRLIGHAHPRWANRVRPWFERAHVPFVDRFEDVCRQARIYVCDNSSTLFEFPMATGRPVVVMNGPLYRRGVDHGLRFWSAAHVGPNVTAATITEGIDRALEDPQDLKMARVDALKQVYGHWNRGAERAAAALTDWATDQALVA